MASQENTSDNCMDEGSDEEFSDALFDLKITATAADSQLSRDLVETEEAIRLFFNNEFTKAKELMKKDIENSLYHSIGYSTMLFLEALMTFEASNINDAMASIKDANSRFQKCRRKEGLGTSIGKALGISNTAELTEEELHAELIFAEFNLFRAMLTFIQDENLISFIKGAWKIRQCYQMYNYCNKLVGKMDWQSDNVLQHFAGGVFMGCGSFNVYMSLLPPKIVSLLEWVGFTSDKNLGFEQLSKGYEFPNLRSGLCSLFIMGYHLFAAPFLGTHDEDLVKTHQIISSMLSQYPNGVYFLLFKGRLEGLKGNIDEAIDWLERGSKIQQDWKQFSHICYWELMWCHALKMDWENAGKYANLLRTESRWSKAIYTYLYAMFLIMKKDGKKETADEIDKLMGDIESLRQRIAGKSIPMEKFVARKARKYFEQGKRLILPGLEMLYLWTGMVMLGGNAELRKKQLDLIDQERERLEEMKTEKEKKAKEQDAANASAPKRGFLGYSLKSGKSSKTGDAFYYFDDYCLLQLIKGVLLDQGGQPLQAELCLTDVKENYKGIKKDHYVTPFALVELAWMFIKQKRYDEAKAALKSVKQDYKHYSHESKLHFKMHAAQSRLSVILNESKKSSSEKSALREDSSSNGVKF